MVSLEILRTVASWVQALAVIGAVIGVFLTWKQVKFTRRQVELQKNQSTTRFEDELTREYRELARKLPVDALLGEPMSDSEIDDNLEHFYSYVDLTNEQVFLRHEERVSPQTWEIWCDGIESHLQRPAFRDAWEQIWERADGNFSELHWLDENDFDKDPAEWESIEEDT